jgi:8-oxo-dGTP pyrophosphatase MutT (NUDIX family)
MNNIKVICRDIKGNKKKFNSEELTFRPSVYGILIENNKILLGRILGKYDLPGGGVEKHEDVEEALKREFFEETGVDIEVGEIVDVKSNFFIMPTTKKPLNSILMFFKVKKIKDNGFREENLDDYEKSRMKPPVWVDISEIDEIDFINTIGLPTIIKKLR